MKWYTKLLVLLAIGTLIFVIGGMTYVVKAKYSMNDYAVQLGAAFNAANIVNATETHTDAQQAVIASHNGQQSVIVPENYKALSSYLRRDHAMPLIGRVQKETALHISICAGSFRGRRYWGASGRALHTRSPGNGHTLRKLTHFRGNLSLHRISQTRLLYHALANFAIPFAKFLLV